MFKHRSILITLFFLCGATGWSAAETTGTDPLKVISRDSTFYYASLVNDYLPRIASILDRTADELVLGYAPPENPGATLNEIRARYLQEWKEAERMYLDKISGLEETVRSYEARIALLEDLVRTKDEIISMLKKEKQG